MPDKKLTPIMELFIDIEKHIQFTSKYKEKFIEKERQMVIDTYVIAFRNQANSFTYEAAKQYYTETYKS